MRPRGWGGQARGKHLDERTRPDLSPACYLRPRMRRPMAVLVCLAVATFPASASAALLAFASG